MTEQELADIERDIVAEFKTMSASVDAMAGRFAADVMKVIRFARADGRNTLVHELHRHIVDAPVVLPAGMEGDVGELAFRAGWRCAIAFVVARLQVESDSSTATMKENTVDGTR